MKNIEIGPIRPPSESNSLLVRVTRGCHWNKCYFCGLYKSMRFSMRPIEEIIEDIEKQAQFYKGKKIISCFLQDGDALVLKTDYLLRILETIHQYFPDIQYITSCQSAVFCFFCSFHSIPELFTVFPFWWSHRWEQYFLINETMLSGLVL